MGLGHVLFYGDDVRRVVEAGLSSEARKGYIEALQGLYSSARRWAALAEAASSVLEGRSVAEIVESYPGLASLVFGGLGRPRGAYLLAWALLGLSQAIYDSVAGGLKRGRRLEDMEDLVFSGVGPSSFTVEAEKLALEAGRLLKLLGVEPREPEEPEPEPRVAAETLASLVSSALKVLPVTNRFAAAIQALRLTTPRFAGRWLGVKVPGDERLAELGLDLVEAVPNRGDPETSLYATPGDSLAGLMDRVSCHAYTLLHRLPSEAAQLLTGKDTVLDYKEAALKPYEGLINMFREGLEGAPVRPRINKIWDEHPPVPCLAQGIEADNQAYYYLAVFPVALERGIARLGGAPFDAKRATDALSVMSVAGLAYVVAKHSAVSVVYSLHRVPP